MIFEKGNAFVQRVMNFIPRTFNIDHPASTGYLLLTHTLMRSNNLRIEDDLVMADGVSVVAKDVFSPISAVKTNLKIFNSVLVCFSSFLFARNKKKKFFFLPDVGREMGQLCRRALRCRSFLPENIRSDHYISRIVCGPCPHLILRSLRTALMSCIY